MSNFIEGESAGHYDLLIGETVVSADYLHSSGYIVLTFSNGAKVYLGIWTKTMFPCEKR